MCVCVCEYTCLWVCVYASKCMLYLFLLLLFYLYRYLSSSTRCAENVSTLMQYLPRQKWTMNETLIFFKMQNVMKKYRDWSCIYQDRNEKWTKLLLSFKIHPLVIKNIYSYLFSMDWRISGVLRLIWFETVLLYFLKGPLHH